MKGLINLHVWTKINFESVKTVLQTFFLKRTWTSKLLDSVFKLRPWQKVFLSLLILYTWKCVRYGIFESDKVFGLFLKCNIFYMIRKIEITWNNIWRIGWPLQCTGIKIWVLIGDNLSYRLTLNDAKKLLLLLYYSPLLFWQRPLRYLFYWSHLGAKLTI